MVSFTGHEGSESINSSESPDPGSTTEVLKGSAPATPHISAENNDSSELIADLLNDDSSELVADDTKNDSSELVADEPKNDSSELVADQPNNGSSELVADRPNNDSSELVADQPNNDSSELVADQPNNGSSELVADRPNNGSSELVADRPKEVRLKRQLPSLIPGHAPVFVSEKQYEPILRWRARRALARDRIRAKVKKHRARDSAGRFTVAMGNEGKTDTGIPQAPIHIPDVDFYGPFVATNEDEEHVGEDAYNSILNLEAPDVTEVLKIMMGDKYNTGVAEEFRNMVSLESPPDFTALLLAMNNTSFDEAADDGYYCVDRVVLRLSGWL